MKKLFSVLDKLGVSLQIFKTALAAAISWMVATQLVSTTYPYFAPLAAILTVQVTVADSLQKAIQRITGIIGGVIISLVISRWFSISPVSIFLVIFIGMAISRALKMNPQVISQVGVSSFLVLMSAYSHGYVIARIVETLLGSAIAVIINSLMVPQKVVAPIKMSIVSLSKLADETLCGLLPLFQKEQTSEFTGSEEVGKLLLETNATVLAYKTAQQGIKYTPFLIGVKSKVQNLSTAITHLEHITVQIRGIRRGLADIRVVNNAEVPFAELMQQATAATAGTISLYGLAIVNNSEKEKDDLRTRITQARELQHQCLEHLHEIPAMPILRDAASILTDLNRILTEVEPAAKS